MQGDRMNEKILITGSTGFIGKGVVSKLKSNYEIHTLERYITGRYTLDNNTINHYANLTDYSAVRNIIREVKPDYVIHLAAISAVSFSYEHPLEVSEVNYLGSVNLAEACYKEVPDLKQFVTAGTSEMYGMELRDKEKKLTETSPLIPNSPYAVAKTAFSHYLNYMHLAYDFPYTEMRPFNTYGRTDNRHFFIERTITQMIVNPNGKVYLGDPKAIRDWLYADDHVQGYIKALGNTKAIGESFNLSTGIGYTTEQTAEYIANLTGFTGHIFWHATPPRPLDAEILIGDNSKSRRVLGWNPEYSFEKGLRKTIEYWSDSKRTIQ